MHEGDFSKISGDHAYDKTGRLEHALDFICDEGMSFYAALDGEVVSVVDHFKEGGPEEHFFDEGNRLVIRHANGEYTAYEHFEYKGLVVKFGDQVEEGQLLGYTGATGYILKGVPHLHFEVFHFTGPNAKEDYQTDPVDFKEAA